MMRAILFLLLPSTMQSKRIRKQTGLEQERMDTQKTLMEQTNSTADKQPALVSQTVTGNFETHEWQLSGGNSKNHSGKMAIYINADSGNIRLDYSKEVPFWIRDYKTEMTREETSYLLSQHDKKIYYTKREYYSNGTEDDVFQLEHASTYNYDCVVADLPDAEVSKYMDCVREQFSKRWFLDQYELKDSYKVPPATGPSSMANILNLYVNSNYGIHVSDEGGITKIDMSVSDSSFNVAKLDETSGSWKTEYLLGNPEAKHPTVFNAPVFKPDEAPGAMPRYIGQGINRDCRQIDPKDLIPLHMGKSLSECLAR